MSLIKRLFCGEEISSEEVICPKCDKRIHTRKMFNVVILITVICLACVGVYGGIKYEEEKKEKKIEQFVLEAKKSIEAENVDKIKEIIAQLDEYNYDTKDLKDQFVKHVLSSAEEIYPTLNFPEIYSYYDKLDELGYDTSELRDVANYDEKNYSDIAEIYSNIQIVNDKLHSGEYGRLSELMRLFDDTIDSADKIQINEKSKLGLYLNDLRTDPWYTNYKDVYYHTTIDLDYGLTSEGHAFVITVYTEPLAKIEFPYDITQTSEPIDEESEKGETSESTDETDVDSEFESSEDPYANFNPIGEWEWGQDNGYTKLDVSVDGKVFCKTNGGSWGGTWNYYESDHIFMIKYDGYDSWSAYSVANDYGYWEMNDEDSTYIQKGHIDDYKKNGLSKSHFYIEKTGTYDSQEEVDEAFNGDE